MAQAVHSVLLLCFNTVSRVQLQSDIAVKLDVFLVPKIGYMQFVDEFTARNYRRPGPSPGVHRCRSRPLPCDLVHNVDTKQDSASNYTHSPMPHYLLYLLWL